MDRDAVEEFIETQDKANGLDTKVKMEASSDGGSMRSSKGIQLQVTPTKVNPSRSESHPLKEDAVISAGEREEKGKENRIRRSNTWKRRSLITPLMSPEQKQQQQQLQLQQLQQQQQQQSGKNGDMSWTPLGRNRRNTGECSDGQQSVRSSIGSINSAMLEKVDTDLALTLPFETSGQEVSGHETSNLNANNNSNNINNQGQGQSRGQGQGHGLDLNSNQSQSQNNISTGNRSPSNAEDVDALLQSLANKELEILERTRKMHDLFRQIKAEDRMIQQTAAELQQLKKKVSELVGTGHQYEKNYSMSRGNSTSSGNSGIAANQSKKPASLWSKSVSLLSQFDQMIQGTMETKLRMMDAESGEQSETTSEASEVSGPGSGPKKREQESAVAPTSSIWSLVNEFKQGLGLVGIEEEEEADGTPTTASTTTDADSSSKHSQHVTGDVEMHAL